MGLVEYEKEESWEWMSVWVMRCLRYGNGSQMHVRLNGEPLQEVVCFKYLGSQMAVNGGCVRDVVPTMNWGV